MKSCFFIGHRDAPEKLFPVLQEAIEKHISEYGVTEFVVGRYGRFDRLAARAVISLKQQYPQITLSLLLPYHPAERPIETPPGFDNTFFPPGMENIPRKLAIVRVNRYMIDTADHLICYVSHFGNARNLLEYAQKHGVSTLNLAQEEAQTVPGTDAQPREAAAVQTPPVEDPKAWDQNDQ